MALTGNNSAFGFILKEDLMLLYEHERTQDIVERLTSGIHAIHTSVIMLSVVGWAAALGVVGTAIGSWVGSLGGLVIGGIVGYGFGKSLAKVALAVIEWMAQVLVVQGQILETLQKEQDSGR
jgi:hypothetical protein